MYNDEKYFDTEKLLDEALKTEPQFELSANFADVLAEKIGQKFAWQQYFREFMIYVGAIVGLLAVPVAIQLVLFGESWHKWLGLVGDNISIVGGITFLVMFVLFADRVLLRYFMFRSAARQV
jgi:hypothetical protein